MFLHNKIPFKKQFDISAFKKDDFSKLICQADTLIETHLNLAPTVQKRPVKYNVIMEGGGLRGISHLGVLYALEKLGYRWHSLGGTSAGSLTAALIACNTNPVTEERAVQAAELVYNLSYLDFLDGGDDAKSVLKLDKKTSKVRSLVMAIITIIRNIKDLKADLGINPREHFSADLRHKMEYFYQGNVETNYEKLVDIRLKQSNTHSETPDFQAVVFNLNRSEREVLPSDLITKYGDISANVDVLDIAKASSAIPFFFKPVEFFDHKGDFIAQYVDGGIVDNLPSDLFEGEGNSFDTILIELIEPKTENEKIDGLGDIAKSIFKSAFKKEYVIPVHLQKNHIQIDLSSDEFKEISLLSFDLSVEQRNQLFLAGVKAALKWAA